MTTEAAATAVRAAITVQAPIERAFQTFTEDIASWWPEDHHIIEAPLARMVFDPRAGGHVYDIGTDGSECRWARVLAWDPPHRVVFTWDIDTEWKLEQDPARASEVEVTFTAEGPERTLVELEHRHLERHGEGWEQVRGAVGSPGGWMRGLQALADRLAA